jgi:predicted DNA-binding transcriptional regulator AlpA
MDKSKEPLDARFWSCERTANYLGVSVWTLYKKMSNGTCPIKVKKPMGSRPKFDSKDVIEYADNLN